MRRAPRRGPGSGVWPPAELEPGRARPVVLVGAMQVAEPAAALGELDERDEACGDERGAEHERAAEGDDGGHAHGAPRELGTTPLGTTYAPRGSPYGAYAASANGLVAPFRLACEPYSIAAGMRVKRPLCT